MTKSNFARASRCLLVGGAGLGIDSAHSFLAPQHRTRIRPHRQHVEITTTTSLRVHTEVADAESKKTETTSSAGTSSTGSGLVDELWANQNAKAIGGLDKQDELMIDDQDASDTTTKYILIGGTALVLAAAAALAVTMGNDLGIDLELGQLIKDPSSSFDMILKSLETMDPQKGMLYFSSFYILAEILAIPAVPIMTASSGYLFGLVPGTATCLVSAAVAASLSFVIGRTLLRGYVEEVLDNNPKFRCMDRAIEKEGFKLMLLLRLSPLFPFALSNYLYGASSIRFFPYFFGTLLGFAPGTFAYVYAGQIGKALTIDSASSEPWYVYAGGMAVVVALIKIAGDVASGVIDSMEEDCEV